MQTTTPSRLSFSLLALLATLSCATVGCGQHGMSPPENIALNGTVVVPLETVGKRLVVSAKVNGRGPFKFILDSGAAVSLLSDNFARDAGLPVQGEMQVGSPGSKATKTATINQVEKLEIGGITVERFTMLAMDLSRLQKTVPGLEGVLSVRLFDGLLVSYDYPANQIEFRRGELSDPDGQTVFSWPARQLPNIVMDIAGVQVPVDLDTGSQGEITISKKYAETLQWLEAPVEGKPIRLLDTEYKNFNGRLKGVVRFGKYTLENPLVSYHEGPFNNVGYAVLKDFAFTIDPANRRFELRKP